MHFFCYLEMFLLHTWHFSILLNARNWWLSDHDIMFTGSVNMWKNILEYWLKSPKIIKFCLKQKLVYVTSSNFYFVFVCYEWWIDHYATSLGHLFDFFWLSLCWCWLVLDCCGDVYMWFSCLCLLSWCVKFSFPGKISWIGKTI